MKVKWQSCKWKKPEFLIDHFPVDPEKGHLQICLILFLQAFYILAVIRQDYLIILIHQRRSEHEIGSGPVAGDWNIPDHAKSE